MNTEMQDPRYRDLEQWPTATAVEAMLEGQMAAIASLQSQVAVIAHAAEEAAVRLGEAGRLAFVGAGTSGRLAVLDGTELYPTFGWPMERMLFLMAGGMEAMIEAREGAEDDAAAGRAAIAENHIGPSDVVIAVAASGRTPYTLAAVEAARSAGALTIAIANNPGSALLLGADHAICAHSGSEVVAGSTRMKAGTAQKAALNLLSTAMMMRRGLVYQGRMIAMRISNVKLLQRARGMVQDIAGVEADMAAQALNLAGDDIRLGVIIAMGAPLEEARALLQACGGDLRQAMARLNHMGPGPDA